MSEITRYEPDVIETNDLEDYADCVPAINGEYVRYEDHARLLAETEAEVERLKGPTVGWMAAILRRLVKVADLTDPDEPIILSRSATIVPDAREALAMYEKESPHA